MPLGPFDEYLAHQTSDTFDHVATSDRNFYDRYYFNMHASSDELFVITGLGQYPNLGVTDAFITVSIGTEQHTVRASRELGSDRMDTSVGPLSVEVLEGLLKLRIRCEENEWGVSADLTFTGSVAALEEPRTFIRRYGRVIQDVTRYAQVGTWEGTITAAGQTFDVTPDKWKGARDRSWGVRPVGEPEHPGIKVRGAQDGYGFRHDWLPMQFDDHMLKVQIDQDADGNRMVEESARVWNLDEKHEPDVEELGRPDVVIDYLPGTRRDGDRPRHRRRRDHRDEHAVAHAVPRRRLRLCEHRRHLGPRRVPGSARGRGVGARPVRPRGAAQVRDPQRDAVPVRALDRRGRLRHAREHARGDLPPHRFRHARRGRPLRPAPSIPASKWRDHSPPSTPVEGEGEGRAPSVNCS
jgi:hypothetical protein